ncbi:hypothetical protein SPI_01022 [Niveomyces insectorum RCEF 264]|uniref:Uncharacterized protein n=1 Tax=Niveomyces insectorum RCEF 264 TaxID=1081102 RepID=A0A167YLJ9_9HYPO|nr:hypothetical protein SPI_01022 [Niveomyces insectorum RCEF 264]
MHRRERRCSPSRRRYHDRLSGAVSAVDTCLYELAKLGRSGQWILHHEDLYHATHDTRPHSRHLDKEVPIKGLTYHEAPIKDWGMIWAGKGPTPDFTNVAFWETKRDELEKKLEQVKAGLVQPRFTSKELQTLESLELQWVLHHEELYHPVIDTRPQTRMAETSVVIRDSTFKGDTRVLGDGILYDYELTWAGNGRQPDFNDFLYWRNKASDLLNKTHQVEDGLVQPNFTPEELRALEAMERNQDHYFGQCARREKPSVVDTPESRAASAELRSAKVMVQALLMSLWTDGYPGQWVLYHQNLYIPEIDMRSRDRDRDEEDTERHVLIPGLDGMCYDGGGPLPDFEDIAYWEEKKAELQKKRAEIAAGKIEHHFTRGELMSIELVESAAMERHRRIGEAHRCMTGGGADQITSSIDAWLGTNPGEGRPPSPPPPPLTLQGHSQHSQVQSRRQQPSARSRDSNIYYHHKSPEAVPKRQHQHQ